MDGKRFTLIDLDDDAIVSTDVDLAAFYVQNDIGPEEANAIGALDVGADWLFGGGASTTYSLRRDA